MSVLDYCVRSSRIKIDVEPIRERQAKSANQEVRIWTAPRHRLSWLGIFHSIAYSEVQRLLLATMKHPRPPGWGIPGARLICRLE